MAVTRLQCTSRGGAVTLDDRPPWRKGKTGLYCHLGDHDEEDVDPNSYGKKLPGLLNAIVKSAALDVEFVAKTAKRSAARSSRKRKV